MNIKATFIKNNNNYAIIYLYGDVMITKERIFIWDNLKFILIFLVVLGHFVDFHTGNSLNMKRIFFYIYIFHMPLFIFISGLFSKKTINEKRYKKIFEYLILYLNMKILFFVVNLLIKQKFTISFFAKGGLPWFILSIIWFHLLTIFLKKLDPKYLLTFSIILACFVGYDASIADNFALSRTIIYYPFFLCGYYLDPAKVVSFCKQRKIQILSIIFIIISIILCFLLIKSIYQFRPLLTGRNPFFKLGKYEPYGCILRFLYYIGVSLFIISFISLTPTKETIASKLGQRSIQVYVLHFPIITIFYQLLNGKELLKATGTYLTLIQIALLLTIFLSLKIFEKPISLMKTIKLKEKD